MDMFYVKSLKFLDKCNNKYLDTKKVLPKYGFQHKNERFWKS